MPQENIENKNTQERKVKPIEKVQSIKKIEKAPPQKVNFDAEHIIRSIDRIKKEFGDDSIINLQKDDIPKINILPTGSMLIDNILGIGGYPYGRVVEIFGPESSAKTTLALHAIAECQKKGETAAFIDVEHALDPYYARNLGINLEQIILSQPSSGEQALAIVESIIKNEAANLIVVDSVAALAPQAELNGEMEDVTIGAQARLMSKALRKITSLLSKKKTILIFINQVRDKIGVFFGNRETTPGGRALKFYSSLRIEVRRAKQIKQNNENVGIVVRAKIVKNKLAPPYQTCMFNVIFSKGIDKNLELIEICLQKKIITKKGSWIMFNNEYLGQGVFKSSITLQEKPELREKLLGKIFVDN